MWSETADWQVLYKEYHTLTSTISGNTSVSLPEDFRKIASYPEITYDGSTTKKFPEVRVKVPFTVTGATRETPEELVILKLLKVVFEFPYKFSELQEL